MNVLHFSEIAAARTGPHRPPPAAAPLSRRWGAVRANEAALYPRPPPLSTPFRKIFSPPFFPLFPLLFRSFRPRRHAPAKFFSPSRPAVPTLFPACPPSPSPSSPGKEQAVRRDAEESGHASRAFPWNGTMSCPFFHGMEPCFREFSMEWNRVSSQFCLLRVRRLRPHFALALRHGDLASRAHVILARMAKNVDFA